MGTKISQLPAASAVVGANLLPIVQSSVTNQATVTQLFTSPVLVTPALGTPTALVGTNITGTAAGLTAGAVTTNANLTGPITSVGNATTIAGPIPAVTLSGIISGGGNQINNVVIGTTTPLAGSFTQVSASSKVLVGATSSAGTQGVQVFGLTSTGAQNVVLRGYGNDANSANLYIVKTRGTTATSFDLVSNDDTLGQVAFFGSNGTSNSSTGLIYAKIGPSATWGATSATSLPTLLGFSTTAAGSVSAVTRLTIQPNGQVEIGDNLVVGLNQAIPAGGVAGQGIKISATANFGIFYGSGAPTLSAAQGSLYLRSDGSSTSTRMYVNTTGSTTWTAVTTAA